MLAYHNDPSIKGAILAQLQRHADADQLVKGQYWEYGKGCAVGCTIYSGQHVEYEARFGIPQMLARLEDAIFEGLPIGDAKAWPMRFMGAVRPGTDLSRVGWQLLHWLLTDESVNPGINHPLVKDAVRQCADVIATLAKGDAITESAARIAACAAWSAARIEEGAARSAESAACAAWSAARIAEGAAWSAESAACAAWRAARGAESAAWRAARGAESAAWIKISNKLVKLIEAAP